VSSFVLSFIQAIYIAPLQSTATQRRSRHSTDTVPNFHAEAPQAAASEILAQGPYVAARARFEPATLQTKGFKSTNEPLHPTSIGLTDCDAFWLHVSLSVMDIGI